MRRQLTTCLLIFLMLSVVAHAHTGKHYPFMKDFDGEFVMANWQVEDQSTRHKLSANSVLTTYLEFQHFLDGITLYDYLHSGVDFAAPDGTIVWCCKSGVVKEVSDVADDYKDSMSGLVPENRTLC